MEPCVSLVKWRPYPSSPSLLINSVCRVSRWPVNSSRPFATSPISSFRHLSTYCDIHAPSRHLQTLTRAHTHHVRTHQLSAHDCSAHHLLLTALMLFRGTQGMCCHMCVFVREWGEKIIKKLFTGVTISSLFLHVTLN